VLCSVLGAVLCPRCEVSGLLQGLLVLDHLTMARILVLDCVILLRMLASFCKFFKRSMTRLHAASLEKYGDVCLVRCLVVSAVVSDVC